MNAISIEATRYLSESKSGPPVVPDSKTDWKIGPNENPTRNPTRKSDPKSDPILEQKPVAPTRPKNRAKCEAF